MNEGRLDDDPDAPFPCHEIGTADDIEPNFIWPCEQTVEVRKEQSVERSWCTMLCQRDETDYESQNAR